MNRLAHATSPYLLQHKENPVDWWEWGPDALAQAKRSNRPILLSVGYAACHWCHVMAHESFEDPDAAAAMNELFINIKVDREERPDVDHVYMSALQALGERGGWPLTMFLTPEGEPFWGGTYFPKEDKFGRPGFVTVLREVARVFREEPGPDRAKPHGPPRPPAAGPEPGGLRAKPRPRRPRPPGRKAGRRVRSGQRRAAGRARSFPTRLSSNFLGRYARRGGDREARARVRLSLEKMALGGIHDHLGGGFARYSVDARWLAPHFEKMLYDNAQLLELYAVAAQDTGSRLFASAADGIVAWLEREMTVEGGAFASSLDADSEGVEGRFYVWSLGEIREVLGADADLFARVYDVTQEGNWEGTNILNLLRSGEPDPKTEATLAPLRERLLTRRATRVRPGRDDKVLADWNGLMIAALVRAGLALDRPAWVSLAEQAFGFIAATMTRDGRLGHSWRAGALIFPGFALDHAALMRAALGLHEATGAATYLDYAKTWRDALLSDYLVPETGLLAMTAQDTVDPLLVRPQPSHDDAVPNANGVFAEALARLAALTGAEDDRRLADETVARLSAIAWTAPAGHASILNALDLHLRGLTVIVAGDDAGALRQAALRLPYLDRLAVAGDPAALAPDHPAKAQALAEGGPHALVCAGMRCSLPVTTAEDLARTAEKMRGERV